MRRLALGIALLLAPVAAAASGTEPWPPDVRAAGQYAAGVAGGDSVSFAVRTSRRLYGYRMAKTTRSASVVKAMLMVAYLNHPRIRGRPLTRSDLALVTPLIRVSDNDAADAVQAFVGNGALRRLARRAGMRRFAGAPFWGATQITPADQVRLFFAIDRYVVRRHRDTALRLLRSIVGPQRWGIAQARPPAWALYFKSGWVRGIENQVALLRRGRRRVSVAIFVSGLEASRGRAVQRAVARRLLRGLDRDSIPQ
ncbi:hypothetical protein BH20ACT19_BH20ACT19_04940 [soil metagenome]